MQSRPETSSYGGISTSRMAVPARRQMGTAEFESMLALGMGGRTQTKRTETEQPWFGTAAAIDKGWTLAQAYLAQLTRLPRRTYEEQARLAGLGRRGWEVGREVARKTCSSRLEGSRLYADDKRRRWMHIGTALPWSLLSRPLPSQRTRRRDTRRIFWVLAFSRPSAPSSARGDSGQYPDGIVSFLNCISLFGARCYLELSARRRMLKYE